MTTTAAPAEAAEVAKALHRAADGLVAEITDETSTEDLLERLRALRVVFDAVDSGNAAQGREQGILRPHRIGLYHALADRRVRRAAIAEAAGVTENAVGFAFKGQRRGRPATNGNDEPAAEPTRVRKERPGS